MSEGKKMTDEERAAAWCAKHYFDNANDRYGLVALLREVREECAAVAERYDGFIGPGIAQRNIAAAIRALGRGEGRP